jgi:hypothetical protein
MDSFLRRIYQRIEILCTVMSDFKSVFQLNSTSHISNCVRLLSKEFHFTLLSMAHCFVNGITKKYSSSNFKVCGKETGNL